MKQPKVEVKGKLVVITIDTDTERVPSSAGKMDMIASTGGFMWVDGTNGLKVSILAGYKAK